MDFPRPPASRAFRAQGDAFVPIRAAEQVVHESVPWLWRRRRVLGKLVMLDGDPDPVEPPIRLSKPDRCADG